MDNEELKIDLEKFLEKKLGPINQKNIEQEKARHERFLEKHGEKSDKLSERHSSSIYQLITLEGVILAAIVIFGNPNQVTIWLILGICSILLSLFFGVWLQNIATQADYQSHEWEYEEEMKHHWFLRELLKDNSVKDEKKLTEPYLKEREGSYKTKFTYKVLKLFHLNHDKVEDIFKITFLISLLFLMLHFISVPFNKNNFQHNRYQYFYGNYHK